MASIELSSSPEAVFSSPDGSSIDCTVLVEGKPVRYTASIRDSVLESRMIYSILMLEPSKVQPYNPPAEKSK